MVIMINSDTSGHRVFLQQAPGSHFDAKTSLYYYSYRRKQILYNIRGVSRKEAINWFHCVLVNCSNKNDFKPSSPSSFAVPEWQNIFPTGIVVIWNPIPSSKIRSSKVDKSRNAGN